MRPQVQTEAPAAPPQAAAPSLADHRGLLSGGIRPGEGCLSLSPSGPSASPETLYGGSSSSCRRWGFLEVKTLRHRAQGLTVQVSPTPMAAETRGCLGAAVLAMCGRRLRSKNRAVILITDDGRTLPRASCVPATVLCTPQYDPVTGLPWRLGAGRSSPPGVCISTDAN